MSRIFTEERNILEFLIAAFAIVKERVQVDDTGKTFDFFLGEMGTFLENLTGSITDRLWIQVFGILIWGMKSKPLSAKHFDKSSQSGHNQSTRWSALWGTTT